MYDFEQWKPVVGWEGLYEVSDCGRVRSLDRIDRIGRLRRGIVLKPQSHATGHQRVMLYGHGIGNRQRYQVHRLVLAAFVGPCPDGMEGCHDDGDPTNNRVSNLRWDTRSANHHDKVRHGWLSHNVGKTHCPRGHELRLPNLVASMRKQGYRSCLACARARAHAQYRGEQLDASVAQRHYEQIMEVSS